jgi:hypothetical protein
MAASRNTNHYRGNSLVLSNVNVCVDAFYAGRYNGLADCIIRRTGLLTKRRHIGYCKNKPGLFNNLVRTNRA